MDLETLWYELLPYFYGAGGITQFADPNGNAQVNLLQQNGFPAGSLQQVSVSDKGRIVGNYSNGRTIDLAEITLANFSGSNYLKREDGGAQSHRGADQPLRACEGWIALSETGGVGDPSFNDPSFYDHRQAPAGPGGG